MSLIAQPSGLVPAYHPTGEIRSIAHRGLVPPGLNVAINKGQPVFLYRGTGAVTQGGVLIPLNQVVLLPFNTAITGNAGALLNTQANVNAQSMLGVFAGCEYFDVTGAPQESNFWPAAQACFPGTVITAFVWQDPLIEYTIQTDAALTSAATTIGDSIARYDGLQGFVNVNTINNVASPPGVGLSQVTFQGGAVATATVIAATGSQGQLQITKVDPSILNQTDSDPFLQLQVRIAMPQTAAFYVSRA
jgi:hypothetical protein